LIKTVDGEDHTDLHIGVEEFIPSKREPTGEQKMMLAARSKLYLQHSTDFETKFNILGTNCAQSEERHKMPNSHEVVLAGTQFGEPERECSEEEEEKKGCENHDRFSEIHPQASRDDETENLNTFFLAKKVINFRSKAEISRFKKLDKIVETNYANPIPTNKFAEARSSPELGQSVSFADPEMVDIELQC
jgi:hypothetical protein